MVRFPPLAILFAASLALSAQKHYYDTPAGSVQGKYYFNSDSAYRAIVGANNTGLKENDLKEYAEGLAYYHESMLNTGAVYFGWSEAENYLDSLVNAITNALDIDRTFRVFLIRDQDVNASAQDNGIIYVYVGLLAEVKDEAALISVLAHEISHVIHGDMKNSITARSRQRGKPTIRNAISLCHGNRLFESRADSLGFVAATALNYDISSNYAMYAKFEADYTWYKSQYDYQDPKWYIALDNLDKDKDIKPDSLAKFLMDHPENSQRLKALSDFKALKNGSRKFSGNETFFRSLQQKARLEQLYISFTESSYKNCLRDAFYFHLLDQENQEYIYYIAECLRRLIFINPALKKKGFLTEDSKEAIFEPDKGILHDVKFISLDTVFVKSVKHDPVYGPREKPFETYSQAFSFFYKKLNNANNPDRHQVAGLYELARGKNEKGLEHIRKHLDGPNPASKEMFNTLFLGSQLSELMTNQTDLVFVENPETYIKEGARVRYSFIQSHKSFEDMLEPFKRQFKINPGYTPRIVFADELSDVKEIESYNNLNWILQSFKPVKEVNFENIARTSSLDENYWKSKEMNDPFDPEVLCRNKNFFYLEPSYWDYFRSQGIHSVTFVKPYFFKHPLLGTYMYFEIAYFDPVNRRYLYFQPEFLDRNNEASMKKMFEKFRAQLSAIYRH